MISNRRERGPRGFLVSRAPKFCYLPGHKKSGVKTETGFSVMHAQSEISRVETATTNKRRAFPEPDEALRANYNPRSSRKLLKKDVITMHKTKDLYVSEPNGVERQRRNLVIDDEDEDVHCPFRVPMQAMPKFVSKQNLLQRSSIEKGKGKFVALNPTQNNWQGQARTPAPKAKPSARKPRKKSGILCLR
ncbi:unnamed protein product [Linum trigynum]|uniref:Uncharacterized protein n=1 Tax=Linum trigynum TaxID=586398 RepID=A0AAV2E593_9ROSI